MDVSGFGSASAATTTASYAKFCSKNTEDRGNESDYQEYVEGVQPGAYAAYAACTTARENDAVQYEMGQAPTRDRLVLGVWNRTEIQATADLEWSGSDPVDCEWTSREVTPAGIARLQPNERATLECRRRGFDVAPIREPDSVNVIRVDGGSAPMLVIPWSKYGPDDNPVMTLEEIRRQLDTEAARLGNEVATLRDEVRIQTGMVGLPLSTSGYRVSAQRGDDALSGIMGERVDFAVPFSRAPEVHIAISSLDTFNGGGRTRVSVRVRSVDRDGFEYELYTWTTANLHGTSTILYSGAASWVAFVP